MMMMMIYLRAQQPMTNYNNDNNKSVQLFNIYVPSQQLQDQLQTQYSVDPGNHIKHKHKENSHIILREYVRRSQQFYTFK
jgi:hypothetical protein